MIPVGKYASPFPGIDGGDPGRDQEGGGKAEGGSVDDLAVGIRFLFHGILRLRKGACPGRSGKDIRRWAAGTGLVSGSIWKNYIIKEWRFARSRGVAKEVLMFIFVNNYFANDYFASNQFAKYRFASVAFLAQNV